MSTTISYFFNSTKSLPDLAKDINACLGCSLEPYQGDIEDWFTQFLGMEFSLRSADYLDNDGDLDFENFAYSLGFRTPWGNAAARPIQLSALAMSVYALHEQLGITGILVFDVQILLARYEEREVTGCGRRLYDLVSDTPFVSFASHLRLLVERLPENWQSFSA